MKISQISCLKLATLILVFSALSSCSGGTASSSFGSISDSDSDAPAGASDGITSDNEIYIGVDSSVNNIVHVHGASSDFSSACSVKNTDSLKDINCHVETPEADLYFKGLSIKYNIPPGMCTYLRRRPYWFYNKEVGTGPANMQLTRVYNASGDLTSFTCTVDGVTDATCSTFREVSVSVTDAKFTCVYDKSATTNGKNCCFGDYTKTLINDNNGTITSTPTTGSWGGGVTNCIAGAGAADWSWFSSNGYPAAVIESARIGINTTYTMKRLIDAQTGYNIGIANFYTPATHTHTGFVSATTSTLPYYIDPVDDRNGSTVISANPTYDFECLDQAWEVLHRIRVYVREWDTYQDFVNYVTSKGTTAVYDRGTGQEGATCTGVTGPCNDIYDHDDFVNIRLGAPYNMATPTNRASYFPDF